MDRSLPRVRRLPLFWGSHCLPPDPPARTVIGRARTRPAPPQTTSRHRRRKPSRCRLAPENPLIHRHFHRKNTRDPMPPPSLLRALYGALLRPRPTPLPTLALPLLTTTTTPTKPFTTTPAPPATYTRTRMPQRPKHPPESEFEESFLKGSGPGGQKIVCPPFPSRPPPQQTYRPSYRTKLPPPSSSNTSPRASS